MECICCSTTFSTKSNLTKHTKTKKHIGMLEKLATMAEDAKNNTILELQARIVLLELENAELKMKITQPNIINHIENVAEQIIESKIIESRLENTEEVDQVCRNVIAEIVNTIPEEVKEVVPEVERIETIYAKYNYMDMGGTLEISYFAGDKMIKQKPYSYEKYQYENDVERAIQLTAEKEVDQMYKVYKGTFVDKYNLIGRYDIKVITHNDTPKMEINPDNIETNLNVLFNDLLIPKSLDEILKQNSPEVKKEQTSPEPVKERKRCKIVHHDKNGNIVSV